MVMMKVVELAVLMVHYLAHWMERWRDLLMEVKSAYWLDFVWVGLRVHLLAEKWEQQKVRQSVDQMAVKTVVLMVHLMVAKSAGSKALR